MDYITIDKSWFEKYLSLGHYETMAIDEENRSKVIGLEATAFKFNYSLYDFIDLVKRGFRKNPEIPFKLVKGF